MAETRWRVWLVLSMLMVGVSAGAQVTDCEEEQDGVLCIDTDGNACTIARCDDEECDQTDALQPEDTACPDTDGNVCTVPSCNAAGDCSQSRSRPSGTECTDPSGQRGLCDGGVCVVSAPEPAPAMSTIAIAFLVAMLLALGFWRVQRRSVG